MAKIVKLSLPPEFHYQQEISHAVNEDNDCSIKALSLLTGIDYHQCRSALTLAGRKPGRGVWMHQIILAAKILGFEMTKQPLRLHREIINSYPERDRVLQHITTHHPRRFAKVWAGMPNMMLETNGHVAALIDGKVIDWSVNRALRVRDLWVLTPVKK